MTPPGKPNGAAPPEAPQAGGAPAPAPAPMMPPPPPPSWAEVMPVLKEPHGYKIDVETDSTLAPDPQAEQEAAVNFVSMFTQFLTAAIPAVAAGQVPADVVGQTLLFVVRRFPVARDLESTIEGWVEKLSTGQAQIAMPPDPKIGLEQDKLGLERDRMAFEKTNAEADRQFQKDEGEAARQAQAQAEKAKLNGPPFVMGEDGAPQGAQALVAAMQQEFEQEMTGIGEAIAQFMQMQAQQNQLQMQVLQAILAALQQPKQKTHAVIKDRSGQVVGAKTIEQPANGGGM